MLLSKGYNKTQKNKKSSIHKNYRNKHPLKNKDKKIKTKFY
jgi:hypothetical protein